MLRMRYETLYGIYNYDVQAVDRPLAMVAMHFAEDPSQGSLLGERMNQYVDLRIGEYFRCSFKDWIEQPRETVLLQIEKAKQMLRKGIGEADRARNELENLFGNSS